MGVMGIPNHEIEPIGLQPNNLHQCGKAPTQDCTQPDCTHTGLQPAELQPQGAVLKGLLQHWIETNEITPGGIAPTWDCTHTG